MVKETSLGNEDIGISCVRRGGSVIERSFSEDDVGSELETRC